MNKFYLIICKNDYPPANQYTILCYDKRSDIPYKYNKLWESTFTDLNRFYRKDEELIYFCCKEDPVEAMISFWSAYMYNIPDDGRGYMYGILDEERGKI